VGAAFHRQSEEIKIKLTAAITDGVDRDSIDSDTPSTTDSVSLLEDKVSVISLLGNTSSGKSFIAQHILTDSHPQDLAGGPVTIDEIEKKGATTANINCYVSLSATNKKTLVLDYEGEKGARFPLLLYARRGLAHLTRSAEKARHRRQAVTDYFPKLAYILSDVVILLGNDDLASTDYLTRCQEFALKANDGVSQMVHRPLLIIIQNKASSIQSVESSAVTQKFFEIHGQEAEALRPFFSDIKCYCLPHTDQLQRTKTGMLDGREIFHQQMNDLKKLLATVRSDNYQRSLTHAQWLYLLQRVLTIVQSGKSVSLHTLLSEIVAHDDDKTVGITIRCFFRLYNETSIHSLVWFADCYRFAIRVLAHCLAVKAHEQRELMSERIIHEWCEKALQQLSIKLGKFQPCVARYTGKGRSSKEKDNEHAVYCYQHKGAHEGGHRTCQSVYGLTRWKEFWGWPSTDVWPGEFESSTNRENHVETFSEEMINDLSRMVRELMVVFQQDPETIYHTFVSLFRHWCSKRPMEIFCCICFCASSSNTFSCDSNRTQNNSSPQRKRRRQRDLLVMQYRLMTRRLDSNGYDSVECQTCYQKLYDAWDKPHNFIAHSIVPTSAQADSDVSKCAKCSDGIRDTLLVPVGYRGFCDSCARSAILLLPVINDNQ
jgi:ABC-type dipeptide/oligopeptide/nickel transport system ATPase component